MPHFRDPAFLLLLALVPLFAARALWLRRRRPALRFPGVSRLAALGLGRRLRFAWLPAALQIAAAGVLAVALARPELPSSPRDEKSEREGIDLAVALDVSPSMNAQDLGDRSRIDTAKDVVAKFVERRPDDRTALVAFSGKAYTQVPLTLDHQAVAEALSHLEAGKLEDGTAIGDAVGVALNRLRDSTAKSKAVILVTDGDNNAGRLAPKDAAEAARDLHIPIFPIVVGKGGAARVPIGRGASGEIVYGTAEAPTNPQLLAGLAETSGGSFQRATDAASLERGLHHVLDAMEKTRLKDERVTTVPRELFGPLLAGALALGALGLVLSKSFLLVTP
ncbi:MAG TPA: VWA domain-containing protein [Myxococcales bacterium]|nr:VWA domain-containing protein [Myxococcales bacterium]